MASTVELSKVTKRYVEGDPPAVDRIDLLVEAGKLVTLLGPSGCGKTTTLRLIAGLETVSAGSISVGGEDVTALPPTERDISMVFQSYALFPHMTVQDNVSYGLRMSGNNKRKARSLADDGLEQVGLAGYGERLPSELSGGQQQRVAVARALVLEPKVLLFDEPLSNLDARLRRRVRNDIRQLQKRAGLTVVYVTHDQEEALAVSDLTVVMHAGRIAQSSTPRDLYERPASHFVADFIGEANLLACKVVEVVDGKAKVALGPMSMTMDANGQPPGDALLAVRPNQLVLQAEVGGSNALPGKLLDATYVGHKIEYTVATDLGELFAVSGDTAVALAEGQDVGVDFVDDGPVLLPPAEEGDAGNVDGIEPVAARA